MRAPKALISTSTFSSPRGVQAISLRGKAVGVVGFNARPIACSLKKAGATVYVSDYWGDEDLVACSEEWTSVLSPKPHERQRQPIEKPLHEALVGNLLDLISPDRHLDYIMFGSGFDDHPEPLQTLCEHTSLVGNNIDAIRRARDRKLIESYLTQIGIRFPLTLPAEEYLTERRKMEFPLVFRPSTSGGGAGIRLIRNRMALEKRMETCNDPSGYFVQEYVRGLDVSCSVLGTGKESSVLSVQGQLIGMPLAGQNCSFAYCGNYIPVHLSKSSILRIEEASASLCTELGLRGSNGFDFVVTPSGEPVLMEVNPRIQGSLELLETAGCPSVTSLHFEAHNGSLPDKRCKLGAAVKLIVYARRDQEVSGLTGFPGAVDRTLDGVCVRRGDPICTLLQTGDSVVECYHRASGIAARIM